MAFNRKPLILTGTMIIMVIALVIRRLPYTIRSSVATCSKIPITVEEAAISLVPPRPRPLPDHGAHDGKRHYFRCILTG